MKVMYVAPRYHTNQVPIIEGFHDDGDEVVFISQYAGKTEDYSVLEPVILGYPRFFTAALFFYKKIRKVLKRSGNDYMFQARFGPIPRRKFNWILTNQNPDIVIMRDRSVYNIGVTSACRKAGIPSLLYTQSPWWEAVEQKGGIIRSFFRKRTPKICITPVLGEEKKGKSRVKSGSYYVPLVMKPHIANEEKEYFIGDKIRILGVGKYGEQKKHDMILQFAVELKSRQPYTPFHVTIVGEATTREQIAYYVWMEKYITEHQLEEYVTLKRNLTIQQVYEEYRTADIFALPSKGDVASVSHLEAMSFSLPVICSDSNGTSCYIEHDVNGYIFKDSDYEDFKRYLEQLFNNRETIIKMGKESYRLVIERHSFEKYKKKILEIESILRGGKNAG